MKWLIVFLGCISTLGQSEQIQFSHSHIIVSLGPEYSQPDASDFVVNYGYLNPFYYRYRGTSAYSGCVMRTMPLAIGTPYSELVRVEIRLNAKIHWRGSREDFLNRPVLRLQLSSGDQVWDRHLSIASLPERQYTGGDGYVASTGNRWLWHAFNPFEVPHELERFDIAICDVSGQQNLFISEIEVAMSHQQGEL